MNDEESKRIDRFCDVKSVVRKNDNDADKTRLEGQWQGLRNDDIPLARYSDASLTRTLRRAVGRKKKKQGKYNYVERPALSAAPTPTHFDSNL